MKLTNLADISLQELADCFNASFSDYSIPMRTTSSQLRERFNAAGISYALSYGAFDADDRLVAFIMHCVDKQEKPTTVFNTGTGVIPQYRGQRLVQRLYLYAESFLAEAGISSRVLEVIQTNDKAIKAYRAIGFEIDRELSCLRGHIQVDAKKDATITYATAKEYQMFNHSLFWNYEPAWENQSACILRNIDAYTIYLLRGNQQTIDGYAVVHSISGLIKQFGVIPEKRGQGYGKALFYAISQNHPEAKILNTDKRDVQTLQFLKKIGLNPFVEQYEMRYSR